MSFRNRPGLYGGVLFFMLMVKPLLAYQVEQDWRQLRTRHFLIIYPAHVQAIAQAESVIAEQAYAQVSTLCRPPSLSPISIVLNSGQDQANGMAYGIMPKMEIYLAPPLDPGEGTQHDSWLALVTTHELMHLAYGLRAEGITRGLTWIFGEVNAVNFIAPQWWTEGIAEYAETALTSGGRGRSPYQAMRLAANLLSDAPWSLAQVGNFSSYAFPFERPYLAGLALVQGLADEVQDPDFLDHLATEQSAWPSVDIGNAWQRAGYTSPGELFQSVWENRTRQYQQRFGQERLAMPHAREVLSAPGARFSQPHWVDDHTLAGYAQTPDAVPRICQLDLVNRRLRDWAQPGLLVGRLGYQPQNQTFYYSRLVASAIDSDTLLAEIFYCNPAGEQRLQSSLRAWSPSPGPDSKLVVVVNDFNTSHLAVWDPSTKQPRSIPAVDGATYYSPCWSPDGKILAAAVRIHGCQDICLVDPGSGSLTALTQWDTAGDFDPAWSPDSRQLFFVSDRTGVHQIYSYDCSRGSLQQITDSRLGAFDPAISPDGKQLAFAEYQVGNTQAWVVAPLTLDPVKSVVIPHTQGPAPDAHKQAWTGLADEGYAPLPHLLPTFWTPNAIMDQSSIAWGIYTGRQDPLRWHSWDLQTFYTPTKNRVYADLGYTYSGLPVQLGLNLFSMPFSRAGIPGNVIDQTTYWAQRRGGRATVSLPWTWERRERGGTFSNITAAYTRYQVLAGIEEAWPEHDFQSLRGSLAWASTNRTEKDFFPTSGFQATLAGEAGLVPSGYNGRLVSARLAGYCPGFLHSAWRLGVAASRLSGKLAESVTTSVPRGCDGGVFNAGQTALFSVGYRFPLWYADWGPGLGWLFLQELWSEVFVDGGSAWEGSEFWQQHSEWSTGLELHMDLEAFWAIPSSLVQTLALTQDHGVHYTFALQLGY